MMTATRPDYLRFTALEDSTVALMKNGNFSRDLGLEYSVNRGEFLPYEIGDVVTLGKDDYVEFRRSRELARAVDFSGAGNDYCYFSTTGSVVGTGRVDTLVYWRGDINIYSRKYSFSNVFPRSGGTLTMSLTIPDSVTSIGQSAFKGCSGFNGSLTISDGVRTIREYAFSGCSGFKGSLTIGDGVTTIERHSFNGCSGFTGNLVIPDSVTSIGESAFSGCSGFTGSLTISDSVTTIGNGTFSDCSRFTGSLVIPDSVTTIGSNAFKGCSGFNGSLTISDGVRTIGSRAFYGCSGFTGSLVIPDRVTTIEWQSFSGCSGFTSLTISDSVTTIGDGSFARCSGFTGNLVIPDSATSIGGSAFSGCSGFTGNLVIPDSVTTIGDSAFNGCRFTNVYVPARISTAAMSRASNGQGITIAEGNRSLNGGLDKADLSNRYLVVKGNLTVSNYLAVSPILEALWVEGDISIGLYVIYSYGGTPLTMFVGVDGTVTGAGAMFRNNDTIVDGCILHFASSGIAATPTQACASYSRLAKVFVGDGSSQAADEAVLALYLADADWAQYSSKLDIWWNYNGPYKTQPVFPTN